jgi:ABC-type transporter Mla subunit MlaD
MRDIMEARHLMIYLGLTTLAVIAVVGGVAAYQRAQSDVLIDTPAVRVETNKATGETKVDAPFAHVEKDSQGTRVDAPGVKVDVPNRTPSD